MTTRREVLFAIGAGVLAPPHSSHAQGQATKVWRIGVLWPRSRSEWADGERFRAMLKQLSELGYIEGQNLEIDWRFANGKYELLPALARELMARKVDLIHTNGTPATAAAQTATRTIPIVAVGLGAPVRDGFALTLARPGGNVTGLSNLSGDLDLKRLELLVSAVPKVSRIAHFVNSSNASSMRRVELLRAALQGIGRNLLTVEIRTVDGLEAAFSLITKGRCGALLVPNDPFLSENAPRVAELALRHKLPTMFGNARSAEAGGLLSYGIDFVDQSRRAAIYIDKIFKGARPGDLPMEQPTNVELIVNLKTARAIGLAIPKELMLRAVRVIE